MTDDEHTELALAYQAARDLLEQARDYLLRLPPVPLTRDLARRLDGHLQAPDQAHVRHVLNAAVREATLLRWASWMPNGEPMLAATVEHQTLHLRSAHLDRRPAAAKALVEALTHGIHAPLEPTRPGTLTRAEVDPDGTD
jgi:hypothetical protein